jgi:membrane associated rhomboid family serine protease
MTGLVEIRWFRQRVEAEQAALVLAAVGIGCRLVAGGTGVGLLVAAHDARQALEQLELHARENAPEQRPRAAPRPLLQGLGAGLLCCVVLLFLHGADRRELWSIDWSAAGALQAGLVRGGAWWRTVTALTLHVDSGHLAANLAGGLAFGMLAAQLLGSGLAWLAILLAGAFGNALDALLRAPDHAAVGASTALFGALGILSGYWRRAKLIPWRGGIRRWAPLAAGIMLLVHLGTSGERTDVGAHVAGFVAGGALGLLLAHLGSHVPQGPRAQKAYGLLACGLVALAWLLAVRAAG